MLERQARHLIGAVWAPEWRVAAISVVAQVSDRNASGTRYPYRRTANHCDHANDLLMTSDSSDALPNPHGTMSPATGPWVFRKAGSGEFVVEYSLHRWVHAPDEVVPELRWTDKIERARRWTNLTDVNAARTLLLKAGVEVDVLAVSGPAATRDQAGR